MSEVDQSRAPLMDHLVELRRRLIWSAVALLVCFGGCFYFADRIFAFLAQPLVEAFGPGQGKLVYTKLYEAFFVEVRVAFFAAFFLAFPIIANQIWAFVAPGLYSKEKRAFLPFLIATPVLFLTGGALAYYVVMPTAFTFFLGYQGDIGGIEQQALPSIGEYLSLVMHFILAFGIAFLLPVLLMLLERTSCSRVTIPARSSNISRTGRRKAMPKARMKCITRLRYSPIDGSACCSMPPMSP